MYNEEIATYIEGHPGVTAAALADRLDVSTRTIRKYIGVCNAAMDGCATITFDRMGSFGCGYYLSVQDPEGYDEWCRKGREFERATLPKTVNARVRFLLNILLMRSDWVTREKLAQILYISPASITALTKQVEEVLAQFDLKLEKRPRYGMRVTGSEVSRRLCWASVVVKELDVGAYDSLRDFAIPDHLRYRLTLDVVDRCVTEALEETGLHISSFSYENLLVHIGIALVRIGEGCYVPVSLEKDAQGRYAREYGVAQRIAEILERELHVALPDEEIAYIAIHLAGKQVVFADYRGLEGESVISDDVWAVVSEILERIWSAFRFDFRGDLELRMNLAQHIIPLSARLHYHLTALNPMASEIRTRYPLAYSMALEASAVLAEHYGADLSDDEVGYLALSVALALERQKSGAPKKNILVACASGHGSARLLEYRYRQEFGDHVDRIETCDVQQVSRVDLKDIDYVFTTVPLDVTLPVPVREVGYFLDDIGVKLIRDLLQRTHDDEGILHYFDPDLFLPHLSCANKEEVLNHMCAVVSAHRDVDPAFAGLVAEREAAAPTAFGGLVALPHPSAPASDTSFVCVALLDNAVEWDEHDVRVVFLLSIARTPDADLEEFYDRFSDVMFDTDSIRWLLSDQRFQTLETIFRGDPPERGGDEG